MFKCEHAVHDSHKLWMHIRHINFNLPTQLWLSDDKLNPLSQLHTKDPGTFWQFWSQFRVPLLHSLISINNHKQPCTNFCDLMEIHTQLWSWSYGLVAYCTHLALHICFKTLTYLDNYVDQVPIRNQNCNCRCKIRWYCDSFAHIRQCQKCIHQCLE